MNSNTWFTRTLITTSTAALIGLGALFSYQTAFAEDIVEAPPVEIVVVEEAPAPVIEEPAPIVEEAPVVVEEPAPAEETPVTEEVVEEETTETPPVVEEAPVVEEPAPVEPQVLGESISAYNPELTTDKAEYYPEETVSIFGRFFNSLQNLVIRIVGGSLTNPDEVYSTDTVEVATNESGEFAMNFTLSDLFTPLYRIFAEDTNGTILAQTSVIDPLQTSFTQCANNNPTAGECDWIGSIIQQSNSTYYEGMTVPQRLLFRDAKVVNGVHTVTFTYQYTKAGIHAYDFLTSVNPNGSGAQGNSVFTPGTTNLNACGDLGGPDGTACTNLNPAGSAPDAVFPIPDDLFDSKDAGPTGQKDKEDAYEVANGGASSRNIYAWVDGGSVTPGAITLVHDVAANGDTGDSVVEVTVPFTTSGCNTGDGCDIIFFFGGHLAVTGDGTSESWGPGLGSSQISGGPYHIKSVKFDGTGGSQDNQIKGADILVAPPQGTISGVKFNDVNGNGVNNAEPVLQNWTITLNPGAVVTQTDANGIYTFTDLADGVYTICETQQVGWSQTFPATDPGNCVGGNGYSVTITNGVNVPFGSLDFGNTNTGTIVVDKVTLPAQDTQSFNFDAVGGSYADFALTDAAPANSQTLTAGAYSVSETVPGGWAQTSAVCVSSIGDTETPGALELDGGETITCTFTNTKNGSIVVDKVTDPSGDPQSFAFTTTGTGYNGFSLTDAAQPNSQSVVPGEYSVAETVPAGWDLSSATCDNGETIQSVDVGPGETVTCTFTNTKRGEIVLIKNTIGGDGTFNFVHQIAGLDTSLTTVAGTDSDTSAKLVPGDYTISETVPAGWDLTSATCDSGETIGNITVGAGETVTCTFVNTKKGKIIIEKQTLPNGDAATFNFTGDIVASLADGQTSEKEVVPGTYYVAESVPAGWNLTNISCDDEDSSGLLVESEATFNVSAGEVVTCTFTNTKKGHIIVDKVTIPSGDAQVFQFDAFGYDDFSLNDAATPHDAELAPGAYNVAESVPQGWDLTDTSCVSSLGDTEVVANLELDPGETITCSFTNTKRGDIKIVKNTLGSEGTFTFTHTIPGLDTSYTTVGNTDQDTSDKIIPGTAYALSEDAVAGWELNSASCALEGGAPTGTVVGGSITGITVEAGKTTTCTFENEKLGKIVFVKNALGGDATFSFTGSFGPFDLTTVAGTATTNYDNLDVDDTYTVAETVPAGWELNSATCDSGESIDSIDLEPGETVTCTFENEKFGKIVLVKNTQGGDGTFTFTSNTLTPGDLTTVAGTATKEFTDLDVDLTYDLAETVPAGWDLTSATCDQGETIASIDLEPGETVTCTFENVKRGHIIVDKVTLPAGDLTSFSFDASGSGYADFNLTDAAQPNGQEVVPGVYGLIETPVAGWDLTSATCSDNSPIASINVAPGETVTCTFTNTKRATITIEKDADPNDCQDFTFSRNFGGNFVLDDDNGVGGCVDTDRPQSVTYVIPPQAVTVTETMPNQYWKLDTASCVVTRTATPYASNLVGTALSLTLTPGADVTCTFQNDKISPTRTQGFWQTHLAFTSNVFASPTFTYPWFLVGGNIKVGDGVTSQDPLTTIGKVMGGFHSNIAKKTDGKQRNSLDKARMQLAQQLIAAKLNCAAFGCPSGIQTMIVTADTNYAGTNAAAILASAAALDAFNNSGDTITVGPTGKADPKGAKAAADYLFWDNP